MTARTSDLLAATPIRVQDVEGSTAGPIVEEGGAVTIPTEPARADVETSTGRVRGEQRGAITAYRGIPYARAARFTAPEPAVPWPGVFDAVRPGPAAHQPVSRLVEVMGPFEIAQSEDCLSLNVWAPAGSGHPVLVFWHGGGFSSGCGGLPWYDGAELAERGNMVVVTANYRLGALGFLRLSGVSPGNLGLLDQLSALRWIRDNIAAFGGDPARVTVSGQSAGAQSTLALLSGDQANGLFQQAILQSTPAGLAPETPERAEEVGETLRRELGIEPDRLDRFTTVAATEVVAAQLRAVQALGPSFLPPFQLVAEPGLIAADMVATVGSRGADGVRILLGSTRDEGAAFFPGDRSAAQRLTVDIFDEPTHRLAGLRTAQGAPTWEYRFDWAPAQSRFGACHCLELPFLLGSAAAWRDAPMLGGEHPRGLVEQMRAVWTAFVHDGDPGWAPGTTRHFTGAPGERDSG